MDGNQREPEQGTHAMHEEQWTRMKRAGHHESDPTADHHEGRGQQRRGEHPQRQVGRAFAHVGG